MMRPTATIPIVVLTLVLGACGADDSPTAPTTPPAPAMDWAPAAILGSQIEFTLETQEYPLARCDRVPEGLVWTVHYISETHIRSTSSFGTFDEMQDGGLGSLDSWEYQRIDNRTGRITRRYLFGAIQGSPPMLVPDDPLPEAVTDLAFTSDGAGDFTDREYEHDCTATYSGTFRFVE